MLYSCNQKYILRAYRVIKCTWCELCIKEKVAHWADKYLTNALGELHHGYILGTSSIKTRNIEINDLT